MALPCSGVVMVVYGFGLQSWRNGWSLFFSHLGVWKHIFSVISFFSRKHPFLLLIFCFRLGCKNVANISKYLLEAESIKGDPCAIYVAFPEECPSTPISFLKENQFEIRTKKNIVFHESLKTVAFWFVFCWFASHSALIFVTFKTFVCFAKNILIFLGLNFIIFIIWQLNLCTTNGMLQKCKI